MSELPKVKPDALLDFFRNCKDDKCLANVCRKIGGQFVELTAEQEVIYQMIVRDGIKYRERCDTLKEKAAERQRKYREKKEAEKVSVPVSSGCHATTSRAETLKRAEPDLSSVDITDAGIFDEGDPVLKACKVTGDTSRSARSFWRKWIRTDAERGEGDFRQMLFDFARELRAGEVPDNKAAAFTQRLKDWRAGKK